MALLKFFRMAACAALMLLVGVAQAAIQTVDPVTGKLTGATGVNVGGSLFDVRFVDGSCISLFSGCTTTTTFAFQSSSTAVAAGLALLDQVFIDTPAGSFDTNPLLTTGITGFAGMILFPFFVPDPPTTPTPNFVDLFNVEVVNGFNVTGDQVFAPAEFANCCNLRSMDTSTDMAHVYAIWTASSVTAVPEPEIYAMMLAGLGVLGWVGSRKTSKTRQTV